MKFNLKELKQTYIIAEMSANHAGCLENAKKIIGAAKEAGADCIKIQTYTPDTMTIDCTNKYFQIDGGTWDGENLYHLYEKAYTPWEWQEELKQQAEELELDFLSTPFDKTSVDFLEDLGVEFYKIASFELVDIPLIEYVASKGKPIILSTGMGTKEEIEEAVSAIKAQENDKVVLLRCSSAYPAVSDEMNLLTIQDMKKYFGLPVGLSDHSMGSVAAVTAVALGARVIEKHFCLNRDIKNPDASFSMEPTEFQQMVQDVRAAERAIGTVNYGPSDQEKNSIIFRRSIFAVEDIEKGETITEKNTRVIRPGYGLKPKEYKNVLGMVAKKHISYGEPLSYDKLEV
jgi:pseudaminic acid synthase